MNAVLISTILHGLDSLVPGNDVEESCVLLDHSVTGDTPCVEESCALLDRSATGDTPRVRKLLAI